MPGPLRVPHPSSLPALCSSSGVPAGSKGPVTALGLHILAELHGCDSAILADEEALRTALIEGAQRCGATVLSHCFHRFSPQGVSGVVVIAESHLAIHTWPEHGYAALDLFTCGDSLRPEDCFVYLQEALGSRQYSATYLLRGYPSPVTGPWQRR